MTLSEKSREAKSRVENELKDLCEKMDRLAVFMKSAAFERLSLEQRLLLGIQFQTMQTYASILQKRLECWEDSERK